MFLNHVDRTEPSGPSSRVSKPAVTLDPTPTSRRFGKFPSENMCNSLYTVYPFVMQLLQKLRDLNSVELVIPTLEAVEKTR